MDSIKLKFGKRIRELRKRMGYTQEQLAEKIGMETPNISKMENGLHFPQLENLKSLAKIFNVEFIELFNFNHFNSKEILITQITDFINNASSKDLIIIYKFIENLRDYAR